MIYKYMHYIHDTFFSKIQMSNKMQNLFFTREISELTTLTNFNVILNFFIKIFSSISINNATINVFFVLMICFVMQIFQNFLSFFQIINGLTLRCGMGRFLLDPVANRTDPFGSGRFGSGSYPDFFSIR